MSLRQEIVKLLLKELLVEGNRNVDWSDVGFTADEESRLNRFKANFTKDIGLVALVDPTTNPMSIVAPASAAADRSDPQTAKGFVHHDLSTVYPASPGRTALALVGAIQGDNTQAKYMTLESPYGTDYQVPTSKVFEAQYGMIIATSVGHPGMFGYGDTAVADGAAAPTTPIYVYGNPSSPAIRNPVAHTPQFYDMYGTVPAAKYPFVSLNTAPVSQAVSIIILGVERAA